MCLISMHLRLNASESVPLRGLAYRTLHLRSWDSSAVLVMSSGALTTSHTNGLPVFLQLGNQLVTLLDDVIVLLVFVVRSISLYNTMYPVNIARNSVRGDEVLEITIES